MTKNSGCNSGCIIAIFLFDVYIKFFWGMDYFGGQWHYYYVSIGPTWMNVMFTISLWIIYVTCVPLALALLYGIYKLLKDD